jgi:hypothetical protein
MTNQRTVARRIAQSAAERAAAVVARVLLPRRSLFESWEREGFHVVPNHFYEPIPDSRELRDELFATPSLMPGVDMRLVEQRALIADFANRYSAEYNAFPARATDDPLNFSFQQGMYGPVDAESLYCMVRHFKPRRVVEIGSGHSTLITAQALRKNAGEPGGHVCEFTSIEPYPSELLLRGISGLSRLIREPVQRVPLALFESLGEGDILFIDSSHVLKLGSDVQYEFLEVLPRIGRGAVVHVHDIFFPCDYPKTWVKDLRRFWNEQYLLHAFLMFNHAFRVLFCGSALEQAAPDDLARAFPSLRRERSDPSSLWHSHPAAVSPASFWMQRTA